MSQILVFASHATRGMTQSNVLRGVIVGSCGLALILARTPLGL